MTTHLLIWVGKLSNFIWYSFELPFWMWSHRGWDLPLSAAILIISIIKIMSRCRSNSTNTRIFHEWSDQLWYIDFLLFQCVSQSGWVALCWSFLSPSAPPSNIYTWVNWQSWIGQSTIVGWSSTNDHWLKILEAWNLILFSFFMWKKGNTKQCTFTNQCRWEPSSWYIAASSPTYPYLPPKLIL